MTGVMCNTGARRDARTSRRRSSRAQRTQFVGQTYLVLVNAAVGRPLLDIGIPHRPPVASVGNSLHPLSKLGTKRCAVEINESLVTLVQMSLTVIVCDVYTAGVAHVECDYRTLLPYRAFTN
ncbi:hypothetical protein MSG28_002904 [Choristoneura fumiferana]|uniref:Uncharacterized protein n=1 Tax=Choristoneura fumiferana TaxID=7141 RepID=A0ACC0JJY9_CHOFU|nr:hypothetical protein MSG28_002904 [Choristoneura fumiferana]